MQTPDPLVALRQFLLTADLSTDAIYGQELPGNIVSAHTNTQPPTGIVLQAAGGLGDFGYLTVASVRVGIRAYGPTHEEAASLYGEVSAALKFMTANSQDGVKLLSAYKESGPFTMREPSEQSWPVTISYWIVRFRDVPIEVLSS